MSRKNLTLSACASALLVVISSSASLAGDKRYCGYIALNQGSPAVNISAGYWIEKNSQKSCGDGLKKVKSGLQSAGKWDAYNWDKKSYYDCKSTKDWFEGINVCNSCMDKKEKGYQTVQVVGSKAITSCERM